MQTLHFLKPQVTQILSMGFSDLYNLKQQTKIFISLFVQKFNYCLNNKTDDFHISFVQKLNYCLNNTTDVVIWADHNLSTKPSIKTLSVDSNSTGLKTPWTKC